jgi:hypothetical protein
VINLQDMQDRAGHVEAAEQDMQDRKRQDVKDLARKSSQTGMQIFSVYSAYHAACDPVYPVLLLLHTLFLFKLGSGELLALMRAA